MQPDNPPSAEEWKMIADHLRLVFRKETTARNPLADAYQQRALQSLGQVINQMPQCGTVQDLQFGRNHTSIC